MEAVMELPLDAEYLRTITDSQQGPSVKQIACTVGMSVDTVYAYRDGKIRIPLKFWRDLFAATGDMGIVRLVTGSMPIHLEPVTDLPDLTRDSTLLKTAIESLGKYHGMQKYLMKILSDGQVDKNDRDVIEKFNAAHQECKRHDAAIFKAINELYQRSTARAAR